ncbi:glycosyltransferase family 4 protein [Salinarchaeum sp. IM2453]|uniref:glycosyltransferase family 4 protein n=1 Tax=Salinarchaeum sp. IM2453 TaxID=2862870 RepID=UPI001C84061C|nr:glycosyltransferase family 4 protein [Salinarchaeum sp. IM2453]QZA89069.1 glycosyltransferase family 4 protein [Salinarchaeum sp. IM2453]
MCDNESSVVVVSQYYPPETGAAPTRWKELTDRWADDTSVTVITSAPDYPEGEIYDGYDNRWLRREQQGNVEVFYTKTITASSGNLLRRSLKFIWFMIMALLVGLRYTTPNAVIATSPQPLTGVSAWILARVKRATFVFEVRDLWPESITAVSNFDNTVVIWMIDQTITILYHRSDYLVVVSQAFIEPIVAEGVNPDKIKYFPNGIDLDFYETTEKESPVLKNVDERFTVSYVGTIGRAHGLSVVLDAAQELSEVQFVIVGDGAEREKLEARAADHENVLFTGRRPKEEIPSILRTSDAALVHLRPREIFETVIPSKLLEAMAAGLPVILGVRGEARRILMEADAGIPMEPNNEEDLINAVRQLQQQEKARLHGAKGREYVVEEFNWDHIAAKYLTILKADSCQ